MTLAAISSTCATMSPCIALAYDDWQKLIEITSDTNPCAGKLVGFASCSMERAHGDDWLQDNDTVAWGVRPSSMPAFINAVVVPECSVLEGHFLEYAIGELGKNE